MAGKEKVMAGKDTSMEDLEAWIEKAIAELSSAGQDENVEGEAENGREDNPQDSTEGPRDRSMGAAEPAGHREPEGDNFADSERQAKEEGRDSEPIPHREEDEVRHERLRKVALPKGVFAHFLLIDIDAPVRESRGVPRYLPLEACCTKIGRRAGARIFLDDEKTVEPMHARVVYDQREGSGKFIMLPAPGAAVLVNGREVPSEGVACSSGDRVQIGSAHLIFFAKNIAEHTITQNN